LIADITINIMEEKIERIFDKGKMNGTTWQFDNIKVGHAVSRFVSSQVLHRAATMMSWCAYILD
jgi:hypothetical protein